MNRFASKEKKHFSVPGLLLPLVFLALVLSLFSYGLRTVSLRTQEERLRSMREAVVRATVQCYAVEGVYPPSLSYLQEHYGLAVDTTRYLVDYQCIAANLMPDITVLPR